MSLFYYGLCLASRGKFSCSETNSVKKSEEAMSQQHSEIALARPVIEVASHRRSFGTRLVETLGAVLGLGDDAVSVVAGQSANETVRSLARGSARSNSFVNLDQLEELCKEQPGDILLRGCFLLMMSILLSATPGWARLLGRISWGFVWRQENRFSTARLNKAAFSISILRMAGKILGLPARSVDTLGFLNFPRVFYPTRQR